MKLRIFVIAGICLILAACDFAQTPPAPLVVTPQQVENELLRAELTRARVEENRARQAQISDALCQARNAAATLESIGRAIESLQGGSPSGRSPRIDRDC